MKTTSHVFKIIISVLILLSSASPALAALPNSMNQQGRLYDVVTAEPIDGVRDVSFALYDSATGEEALWSEKHSVTFDNGYFTVALGSIKGFSDDLFDGSPLFIGIQVGDDSEMSPRAQLGNLPYAMVCEDATGEINPLTVTIPGYGMVIDEQGNWLGKAPGTVMWLDGNGVVSTTAAVGIGTSAPQGKLHIADSKNDGYVSMITENVGTHGAEVALKAANERWNFAVNGSGDDEPGNFALQYDRGGGNELNALSIEKLTGNVGFGTNTPTAELVLARKDASGIGPYLLLTGEDGGANWQTAINLVTEGTLSGKGFSGESNVKGWHLVAKGNSHTASEQQNMLKFNFWNGSDYTQNLQLAPNGNVGIGTASPGAKLEVQGNDNTFGMARVRSHSDAEAWHGSFFQAMRSRGSAATPTAVQSGDVLGYFDIWAYDGNSYERAGQLSAEVDGTVSAGNTSNGNIPMSWTFDTNQGVAMKIRNNTNVEFSLSGSVLGTVMPTNRTAVGIDSNILFNADNRYTVTHSGSAASTWNHSRLFDGEMKPSYTDIAPTPADPVVVLIEDIPGNEHTQTGAWLGWSTRYWPPDRFKIEGYNTYTGGTGNVEEWRVLADYENEDYSGSHFLTKVSPAGMYTKLRFTFYRATGGSCPDCLGISELFFLHPEADRPYSGLSPSQMWEGKDGNVGIGTKAPSEKLEVKGALIVGANGAGNDRGTVTHGVAEFFTPYNSQDPNSTPPSTNDYIHLRLPFDPADASNMFHIKVQGYAYHEDNPSKVIDLTYVGYAWAGNSSNPVPVLRNTDTLDPTGSFNPTIYRGTDGNVYCRFKPVNTYFLTIRVDSMVVGNGRIVNRGEVTIIMDPAAEL